LKHNGQKGREGKYRTGRRFSSYRGSNLQNSQILIYGVGGWAATFEAGICGEEDSSAVRRRNDKTMG